MARQQSVENLTAAELRLLLLEKSRAGRKKRLEHFRRTGRVALLEPSPIPLSIETMRSSALPLEEEVVPAPKKRGRTFLDKALLFIEVSAVLGLLFVLFNGLSLLRSLNSEVISALQQPTLTPTPLIVAVVLPGGHTPPGASGEVRFNEAEIPEHLRPMVQAMASLPLPTPGPEQAIRIQVPAIGIDAPVVQGDGMEQLKKGVGQHVGTPNPGQKGNLVLSAHNDVFGEIFRDLDKLKDGDRVVLFTNQRTYSYIVRQTQVVEPTQVEVMAPTREAVVTLISCYPYLVDNQRYVVTAVLQE